MFQRILYTSQARSNVSIRDVYDIIRSSHNRNSDNGLTGGLLFLDGYFIQVLEGSPYALHERYQRIIADPRHDDITLRLKESSSELLFLNEWMALRSRDDIHPTIFQKHHYVPGMPDKHFNGGEILAFLIDCCASSLATLA